VTMLDVAVSYNRYRFLGREFLTWLWYSLETDPKLAASVDPAIVEMAVGNRMVLENRGPAGIETVTIKGDDPGLEEGHTALQKGALVSELSLAFTSGDQRWRFTLKGESLYISGLKVPDTGPVETEADLAGFKAKKARAFNVLMRHYRNDTLNPQASADSIIAMYQREDELWAKYALVFEYLGREDCTNAVNTLDSIPVKYELSASQLSAHQVYEDYVDIINGLAAQGKTLFQADSADKAELNSLYNNSTDNIHAQLRNLLVAIDTLTYQEPYIFPDLLKSSEAYDDYLEIINTKQPACLKVHPNPAREYVIIEYMQEMEGAAYVYITDLNGKPVTGIQISNTHDQKVLDTRNWKAGIYIATLKINGKMIESVKFSITN